MPRSGRHTDDRSTVLIAAHATTALVCFSSRLRNCCDTPRVTAATASPDGSGSRMTFVATTSFAVRELADGRLSLLHVLSA